MSAFSPSLTLFRTIIDCVTERDCAQEIEMFRRLKSFHFVIYLHRLDLRQRRKFLHFHVIVLTVFQNETHQVEQSSISLPHFDTSKHEIFKHG